MQNQWKNISVVLAAMLVGSMATVLAVSLPRAWQPNAMAQETTAQRPVINRQALAAAQGLSAAFRNVAESLRPSVVS
ncbi:MAG: serine protease, partial [Pirellulales bacterium]|nr:serine protease [Pirellulales bacterium]